MVIICDEVNMIDSENFIFRPSTNVFVTIWMTQNDGL